MDINGEVFKFVDPDKDLTEGPYRFFDIFIILLIVSSIILIVLESFATLYVTYKKLFSNTEVFIVAIFTIEYGMRLCTAHRLYPGEKYPHLKYIISPTAIIDLIAISPFYIHMALFQSTGGELDLRMIRILQTLRTLRILRLGRYTTSLDMITKTIKNRATELFITLVLTCMLILASSILMFHYEHEVQPGKFPNVVSTLWWSVATLTTVGYGDVFPITSGGKFWASIISLLGIGFVALPTGIMTQGMAEEFNEKKLGRDGTIFIRSHIVVLGWNTLTKEIIRELLASGLKVAVVSENPENQDQIRTVYEKKYQNQLYSLIWDINNEEYYDLVKAETAYGFFVAHGTDSERIVITSNLREKFSGAKIIAIIEENRLEPLFRQTGANHVLTNQYTARLAASFIYESCVAEYSVDLLATATNSEGYDIRQYLITDSNPYIGKDYGHFFGDLKRKYNAVSIGLSKKAKEADGARDIIKLPTDQTIIEKGDYVIVVVNGDSAKNIEQEFDVKEGTVQ